MVGRRVARIPVVSSRGSLVGACTGRIRLNPDRPARLNFWKVWAFQNSDWDWRSLVARLQAKHGSRAFARLRDPLGPSRSLRGISNALRRLPVGTT